jgi:hypothetical protein
MKELAKKVLRSIWAGLTSPEAVKAEKILLVIIVTRLLMMAGASAGLIDLITGLIN